MQRRKLRKISRFSRLLAVILCLCVFVPTLVGADNLEEAEARQSELANQKAALESELEQLREDESKAREYQEVLAEKIEIVQQQIDQARIQISDLNQSISALESKLEKAEAEIADTLQTFYNRISLLYRTGVTEDLTSLQMLLSSESLNDLSYHTEALQRFTEHDEQVMDRIEQYMNETEEERTELQVQKDKLAEVKKELESNNDELGKLHQENEIALANIQDAQSSAESKMDGIEEESVALQEEIKTLIAEKRAQEEAARQAAKNSGGSGSGGSAGINNGSSSPDPGYDGGFNPCWPIPGVTTVTQHYGNNGHNGIDIAGPYGTKIVASESGQVIKGNSDDSWGDSWGYYVLIYHNSTYTTRYAHLSSLTVSTGQYVTKGQVIGYEGSTGNSTGPHLHFEIYKNDYRTNPWPYIG